MITFKNFAYYYPDQRQPALEIEDLTIPEGQCLVLCGKSGSGKSTFLRLINGLIPEYYEGHISGQGQVAGQKVGDFTADQASFFVGSVFQNPATQFFHDLVQEELVFPCENQGLPASVIDCRLKEVAKEYSLKAFLKDRLSHLSGGQKQRVAIGTALMQQPRIIVMDEPSSHLDNVGIESLRATLKLLKEAGVTLMIAEQRLAYLFDLADRYIQFEQGQICRSWDKAQMAASSVEDLNLCGLRAHRLADSQALMSKLATAFQEAQKQGAEPALLLENAEQVAGKKRIGHIASLTFPLGEIIGITGQNGIGKTTLINHIAGLSKAKGAYSFAGRTLNPAERLAQTAMVMQDVGLQLFAETVQEEICLGTPVSPQDSQFQLVVQVLGLASLLKRHPRSLSIGQQQRVMIANALLSEKRVFIFDEPTSGLCFENMRQVERLMKELKKEDRLILVVSHDEEFLSRTCDMIYHMQ